MEEPDLKNYQFKKADNEPRKLFSNWYKRLHPIYFIEKFTGTHFGIII